MLDGETVLPSFLASSVEAAVATWAGNEKILEAVTAHQKQKKIAPLPPEPEYIKEAIIALLQSVSVRFSVLKADVYMLLGLYVRMICETGALSAETKIKLMRGMFDAGEQDAFLTRVINCVSTRRSRTRDVSPPRSRKLMTVIPPDDPFYGLDVDGNLGLNAPPISFKAHSADGDAANLIAGNSSGATCPLPLLLARKRLLSTTDLLHPTYTVNTSNLAKTLIGIHSEIATTINNATFQHVFERQGAYVRQLLREEVLDVEEIKILDKEDLFGRLVETVVQDINAREVNGKCTRLSISPGLFWQ
jgi:hypothetical protein